MAPKPTAAQTRAGIKKINQQFGWMPILIRIAKTGLFNLPDKPPIEAAGEADLWTAFSILNYENASSILESETQKEQAKENRRKQR